MFKTSHLQELKRRYKEMYASPEEGTDELVDQYKKETPGQSEGIEEHCGVCGQGITEAAGSITITVKGISDLKKADAQMLRDTDFNIETILQDDGVEIEEGGSTYKRNSITFEADSSDMKIVQKFVKMRNQLSKDTAKLIKPKMDYGDLYQERVDGLYVAGLLSRTAKPNSPLQYSVNFIKEEVELDEKGTAYPATVDTLRKIVKDKQHQTVMFKSGQAIVDLFTASAMVQVYDALKKPDMKKTFEKMITDKAGFMKTQAFAMKMIGK